MKKLIAIIVASVTLLAVLGVGISHVIKANNKESEIVSGELAKYSQVEYFESNQRTEQPAVLRAWAVGEKQFTKITYQIDTQSEVVVAGATYDKVSESWSKYNDDFEDLNYIDTGVTQGYQRHRICLHYDRGRGYLPCSCKCIRRMPDIRG